MNEEQKPSDSEVVQHLAPGQTISPRAPEDSHQDMQLPAPVPEAQSLPPPHEPELPVDKTPPPAPSETPQPAEPSEQPVGQFQFPAEEQPVTTRQDGDEAKSVSWTASEYIAHQKTSSWYLSVIIVAVVVAALIWLATRDKISAAAVIVVALALAFYGRRKPRQLQYSLDNAGFTIEEKHMPYSQFRSFAVVDEGAISSIAFLPLKRFAPLVTVYYDPKDEESIIDLLSEHLPMEDRKADAIDQFMRRIRF